MNHRSKARFGWRQAHDPSPERKRAGPSAGCLSTKPRAGAHKWDLSLGLRRRRTGLKTNRRYRPAPCKPGLLLRRVLVFPFTGLARTLGSAYDQPVRLSPDKHASWALPQARTTYPSSVRSDCVAPVSNVAPPFMGGGDIDPGERPCTRIPPSFKELLLSSWHFGCHPSHSDSRNDQRHRPNRAR